MDPVSQAVVGATFTQSFTRKNNSQIVACLIGMAAGMAADVDVLLRSQTDPLLFLEYHRQFTHSFFFIPIGGLICTLLLAPFLRQKISFVRLYFFTCLGYATHGLLDACTSYGTQLLWPFSDARIAWDIISVIDPLLTVPILILVLSGAISGKAIFPRSGLAYLLFYLLLGQFQHDRALDAASELAKERGHVTQRVTVKPTFGNLLVWKLIYEHDNRYYVDAVRLGVESSYFPGSSVAKLPPSGLTQLSPLQASDVERFRKYSNDFLAFSPIEPALIADIRYSILPNTIEPLWAVRPNPKHPEMHMGFVVTRNVTPEKRQLFLNMLLDKTPH